MYVRSGNPCDLGGEALDVILLALKNLGGDEHGEVAVLHAESLDPLIKVLLDLLPDRVRPRLRASESTCKTAF